MKNLHTMKLYWNHCFEKEDSFDMKNAKKKHSFKKLIETISVLCYNL